MASFFVDLYYPPSGGSWNQSTFFAQIQISRELDWRTRLTEQTDITRVLETVLTLIVAPRFRNLAGISAEVIIFHTGTCTPEINEIVLKFQRPRCRLWFYCRVHAVYKYKAHLKPPILNRTGGNIRRQSCYK